MWRLILPNYLSRKDARNSIRKTTWTLCVQDALREVIREGWGGSPHPVPLWEALFSFFLPFLDFFGPSLSPGLAEVF